MIRSGFVDLQVNGFLGVDFSSPGLQVEDVDKVTRELVRRGTIAYCPTVVTAPEGVIEANLSVLAQAINQGEFSKHLLGIHLEGPFLAEPSRGAHPLEYLQAPDVGLLDRWILSAEGHLRLLTIAPELDGAESLIRHAVQKKIVPALGHHMADDEAIDRAIRAGAKACTHLGNGISYLLPRHSNPLWSQLARDELICMLISDGHHLPPEFLKVAIRAKKAERLIVTSDAAAIAGMPAGTYDYLGEPAILEPSGRIVRADGQTLVGSSATMFECMNVLARLKLLNEEELWQVGRFNPLALLGLDPQRLEGLAGGNVQWTDGFFELCPT